MAFAASDALFGGVNSCRWTRPMLSHLSIEERLKAGTLGLRYYFLPDDAGGVRFFKDGVTPSPDADTTGAWPFFQSQLKSDRLSLTLGPVIKSHTDRLITGRPSFRGRRGYADLREMRNVLVIGPRETISVATNERIALDGKTAALLLPRITLGDAGLLLNTAYIDPYWDGTLQLVLTNSTPHAQSLSLLEPIAQCFFFDLDTTASAELAAVFPGKSHHFGQNWQKILDEDAEPFPVRKRPLPQLPGVSGLWARARNFWDANRTAIRTVAALLLLIAGISSWTTISGPLGRLPELERKVAAMEPYFSGSAGLSVPTLQTAVRDLQRSAIINGSETIVIPANALAGERDVTIDATVAGSAFVIAGTRSPDVEASGVIIGVRDGSVVVRLRARMANSQAQPEEVMINWALIP